ncbi:MAG TPA: TonB-dependent receptor [Dokdonella sp.]
MRSHLFATLVGGVLAALGGAPAGAADAGQSAAPATDPAETHRHEADRSGAKPAVDRANAELPAVVVSAVPGELSADRIVRPVGVLAGAELDDARAATLGQTVAGMPGVQTTAFGQGVGRPVIRGLDGARVAVLGDGLGAGDVSGVSQDHAVTIEPFLADRIEILKGPSTLLYGSGAIGGIVNVIDGRIPERMPDNGISGRVQASHDSATHGDAEVFRVDAGHEGLVLHADGMRRRLGDYDTPSGRLANSFVDTSAGALGASWVGERGHVGVAVSRFLDQYGNPAEPGDALEGEPAVHVRMAQTRHEVSASLDAPFAGIDDIDVRFAHTDYGHVELEGDEIGTTFASRSNEGRVLLTREAGGWLGAFGLQAFTRASSAVGEESFVPPSRSRGLGLFTTARREFGALDVVFGARADRQHSTPQGGDRRDFRPYSVSAAFGWHLTPSWHATLNLDRAQRAPAEEELFAHGPHLASATFEVGDPGLGKETANQLELGLHWHANLIDAKIAAYTNRYDDFIHLADTGLVEDDLPVRRWSQADARFRGLEAEATLHLLGNASGHYDLRAWGDRVRATLEHGRNVPRMPASRAGVELAWRNDDWRASIGATRYFEQDRTAEFESRTPGFTLLDARLAWTFHETARGGWEAWLDGSNLANQVARLSTSLIKDQAPLTGRSVTVGIRAMF